MENKNKPATIKFEIEIDTSLVRSFQNGKSKKEFDDGVFACMHNVNYSAKWTRAKQAGYFWGRIFNLALTADDINEDFQAWKNGIEPKENDIPSDL